jgi:CRISPR-associated exonuclease Cas4
MKHFAEPIMISALEHWSYCPRQCGLIHLENIWDENTFTLRGRQGHERADDPNQSETDDGIRIERALPLFSDTLGLVGRADAVEFHAPNKIVPVEYKLGTRRLTQHHDIQLCAQALCLEEMFQTPVQNGAIYSLTQRRRRDVTFTQELRQATRDAIEAVHHLLQEAKTLPPAFNDARCRHCSLLDACLPASVVAATAQTHFRKLFTPPPNQ